MTLLDGSGWQLTVWWRLKKLVIAVDLGKGKSGFLWRDYCVSTACWDPKCAAWSVELVIKRGGWRKNEPFPWKLHKGQRDVQVPPPGTQVLSGSCYSSTGFNKIHPFTCCRSRNASLHLLLLFSIHNWPLLWLTLDNIIYSIRCQNAWKNVKELMEPSLYLLITWRKKSDEIIVGKWGGWGGKLEITV